MNLWPFKVWKSTALPAKSREPDGIGVPLGFFIREIATSPLPNGAVNGLPKVALPLALVLS